MKFICKGSEPAVLREWKYRANDLENVGWKPQWDNFQNPEKSETLFSLIKEQGNICCYCMKEITPETSHIEHIKPRSQCSEEEKIDYSNLLASCQGDDQETKTIQNHCGHYRKNWYDPALFIAPLNPQCEEQFRFFEDGSIESAPESSGACDTIRHLKLNYTLLEKQRKAAILGIIGDGSDIPSATEILQLFDRYTSRDENGSFLPFCIAVVQVLSMYSIKTKK